MRVQEWHREMYYQQYLSASGSRREKRHRFPFYNHWMVIIFLALYCRSAFQQNITEINLSLPQLKVHSQSTTKNILVQEGESVRYYTDLLSPIYVTQPKICHSHEGQISIEKLALLDQNDASQRNLLQRYQFNQKHSILYRLGFDGLDAYRVHDDKANGGEFYRFQNGHRLRNDSGRQNSGKGELVKLEHIASLNLSLIMQPNYCQKSMLLQQQNNWLYVFSCDMIIRIECVSILSKYEVVSEMKHPSQQFPGKQLYAHGHNVFWFDSYEGIQMYGFDVNGELKFIQEILMTPQEVKKEINLTADDEYYNDDLSFNVASISILEDKLYVLSINHGIFVFQRPPNQERFTFLTYVVYEPSEPQINEQLLIHQNRMYISSSSYGWAFVAELEIETFLKKASNGWGIGKKLTLIRYFKGFHRVSQILIHTGKLLIVSDLGLEMYNIGEDPRKIPFMNNGIANNHFSDIFALYSLTSENTYLMVAYNQISVAEVEIEYPFLECEGDVQGNVYQLSVRRECRNIYQSIEADQLATQVLPFNEYCENFDLITLIVVNSSSSKLFLAIIVSVVILAMIVVCLIYWREKRLEVIDKLVDEIRKIKLKRLKQIEFFESEMGTDSDNKAKETDWNDLEEELPEEELSHGTNQNTSRDFSQRSQNQKTQESRHLSRYDRGVTVEEGQDLTSDRRFTGSQPSEEESKQNQQLKN